MLIDMKEIERIGGRSKNPDIDAALRILELNSLVAEDRATPLLKRIADALYSADFTEPLGQYRTELFYREATAITG